MLEISVLSGPDATNHQEDLATLRITVFREYPYLYDGDLEYEREYLRPFLAAPDSVLVLVRDENRIVGASTASPMEQALEEVRAPYLRAGEAIDDLFYLGESILLPAYRGQGIGHHFFAERERAAREKDFGQCCFCAVERPANHPERPRGYQPLDGFWERRGYRKSPKMKATFAWKEIGHDEESDHAMSFWIKSLDH